MLSDEELLAALANLGHDGPDALADSAGLATWWAGLHRPVTTTGSSPAALAALRDLRSAVQAAAGRHNGIRTSPGAGKALTSVAGVALRPDLSRGTLSLVPTQSGDVAAEVVAVLVQALLRASARPGWSRVKACPGTGCGWVFLDGSRNSSRRWCDMTSCGSRAKTATFRARRRGTPPEPGPRRR